MGLSSLQFICTLILSVRSADYNPTIVHVSRRRKRGLIISDLGDLGRKLHHRRVAVGAVPRVIGHGQEVVEARQRVRQLPALLSRGRDLGFERPLLQLLAERALVSQGVIFILRDDIRPSAAPSSARRRAAPAGRS